MNRLKYFRYSILNGDLIHEGEAFVKEGVSDRQALVNVIKLMLKEFEAEGRAVCENFQLLSFGEVERTLH